VRDAYYKDLILWYKSENWFCPKGDRDQALVRRINQTRYVSHFDAIRLLPCPDDNVTTEVLRRLRQGYPFADPFASNLYLGYIGTFSDYYLISVGPDGRCDILGFSQFDDGEYRLEGESRKVQDMSKVEVLGRALLTDQDGRSYDTKINIDMDKVYDPTNGLLSAGDVVFHRRGGDDFMFSYEGFRQISARNFVKKDLE
jgi:hypothetical protein